MYNKIKHKPPCDKKLTQMHGYEELYVALPIVLIIITSFKYPYLAYIWNMNSVKFVV